MSAALRIAYAAATLCVLAAPADGQSLAERLKKRATDAIQKKTEDKVDAKIDQLAQRAVDNSFAMVFGESAAPAAGGASASGASAGGRLPFSLGGNTATESEYRFNVVMTVRIETSAQAGSQPTAAVVNLHFNTSQPYTGTAVVSADGQPVNGAGFVVLDSKNHAMVMFVATDKNKFSMAYDWKDAQQFAVNASHAEQVKWDTVTTWKGYRRIGSKTVAGYAADGYRAETPDGVMDLWLTRDARLAVGSIFGATASMKQFKGRMPEDMPQGMLLEMTSTKTASGERVTMQVTHVDADAHVSYALSEYPKMELGKK